VSVTRVVPELLKWSTELGSDDGISISLYECETYVNLNEDWQFL
jgi:hypothetical protein